MSTHRSLVRSLCTPLALPPSALPALQEGTWLLDNLPKHLCGEWCTTSVAILLLLLLATWQRLGMRAGASSGQRASWVLPKQSWSRGAVAMLLLLFGAARAIVVAAMLSVRLRLAGAEDEEAEEPQVVYYKTLSWRCSACKKSSQARSTFMLECDICERWVCGVCSGFASHLG